MSEGGREGGREGVQKCERWSSANPQSHCVSLSTTPSQSLSRGGPCVCVCWKTLSLSLSLCLSLSGGVRGTS